LQIRGWYRRPGGRCGTHADSIVRQIGPPAALGERASGPVWSGGNPYRPACDRLQDYLRCGRLEYGSVRVKCNGCRHEHLVAFSCKRRGFCPSCGARRMIETSAHLVDHEFPELPVRHVGSQLPLAPAPALRQPARSARPLSCSHRSRHPDRSCSPGRPHGWQRRAHRRRHAD
jgi:hypothetical protein